MATSTTITTSFDGNTDASKEIFVQIMKQAETIAKGLITIMPNVIGSQKLPTLSYTDTLHDASCGWNPTGTVVLAEREITTKQFEIKNEYCKKDFAQTFQAQAAGLLSANPQEIPSNIKEAILLQVVQKTALAVDNYIWNSATTGLLAQFAADSSVIKVVGATVTASNVVAEIGKLYNVVPDELENDESTVFVVSTNVGKAYRIAQASMGMNTTVGAKELDYMGIRLETNSALPANTILVYRVKNVFFGTGLESDLQNVRVIDHDETSGDGMVRTIVGLHAGQTFIFGGEIVTYRTA